MTTSEFTESATVTTSFTVDEQLLDRVRDLAARRDTSVSKLIVAALQADLVADEIAGEHSNGRPSTGSWSTPTVVGQQWDVGNQALPMQERPMRLVEVRRTFGAYRTVLPSGAIVLGLPPEVLPAAERAFDVQLARDLAARERRLYGNEDEHVDE